jgi:Ca-activated chloride channel family protein
VINKALWEEELATAIGDAVLLGVERLRDSSAKSKVLILLSDGEQTAGLTRPAVAAEAAKRAGVKIYTIGVGSTGEAPFPQFDRHGRPVLDAYGEQYDEPRHVVLDEVTLSMLAERTGGQYFNARSTGALTGVYADIDSLEKTITEGKVYRRYAERYLGFLVAGVVLLLFELSLSTTWLRSLP